MLVTSLTSAVAFSACTTANVMPVRAFGWFATLVVPLVFLQTCFVQPFSYFYYEKHFMHRNWKSFFKKEPDIKAPELDMTDLPIEPLPENSNDLVLSDYELQETEKLEPL